MMPGRKENRLPQKEMAGLVLTTLAFPGTGKDDISPRPSSLKRAAWSTATFSKKETGKIYLLRTICPFLLALATLLSGCASYNKQSRHDLNLTTVPVYAQVEPKMVKPSEGSLWPGENSGTMLFTNIKGRQIGDSITVLINETSTASKDATTKTGKNSALQAGIPNFLGLEATAFTKNNRFDPNNLLSANFNNQFTGNGSTTRSDKLAASMTALIKEVLPNGNYFIEGRRVVRVNEEDQYIVLTGIVRPRDVTADNTVQSTSIAEAKIEYGGNGIVAEKQRQGWLSRFIDTMWPF